MSESTKRNGISGTDGAKAVDLGNLLAQVGWSGAELGRRVAARESTVYNWLHGRARTPGAVIAYLKLIILTQKTAKDLGEIDG